jgi:hypothetical protein
LWHRLLRRTLIQVVHYSSGSISAGKEIQGMELKKKSAYKPAAEKSN